MRKVTVVVALDLGSGKDIAESKGVHCEMESEGSWMCPQEIVTAVEDCGFFESIPLWAVTLIGGLFITVRSKWQTVL